jgi:hypothetical protein
MALLWTMYAYCKEFRPTNTFAGRVCKLVYLRSRVLW